MTNEKQRPKWLYNRNEDNRGIFRQLTEGLSTRIFIGDKSMLSVVRIAPHSQGTIHSHPEEQWGVLLEGKCVRIQEGIEAEVSVGDFWHTPGNIEHGIRTGEEGAVVLDFFSPLRPEYKNPGEGYGNA